jgi:hypothetical protein
MTSSVAGVKRMALTAEKVKKQKRAPSAYNLYTQHQVFYRRRLLLLPLLLL